MTVKNYGYQRQELISMEQAIICADNEISTSTAVLIKHPPNIVSSLRLHMAKIKNSGKVSISYRGRNMETGNIYVIKDSFETALVDITASDILFHMVNALSEYIGSEIANGSNTEDISLFILYHRYYNIFLKQMKHEIICIYGLRTGKYAYMEKSGCINKERSVYEYIAISCNGPLAAELRVQILFVPISKQFRTPSSCLFITFTDNASDGMDIHMMSELTAEECESLFMAHKKNIIEDDEIMEQVLNRYMELLSADLRMNDIDTIESLQKSDALKLPEQYFLEAVMSVTGKSAT